MNLAMSPKLRPKGEAVIQEREIQLQRTYRVELHTDPRTSQVSATLPALNDLADWGDTVEEALQHLKRLAEFALECRQADGEPIPPSDLVRPGELYLSLEIPIPTPAAR